MPSDRVSAVRAPALHATHAGIWLAEPGGDSLAISRGEAIARAAETPVILLNAPMIGQRLGYPELSGLDLLELFAFIHPARFVVPTAGGLARALGLVAPADDAATTPFLVAAVVALLDRMADDDWPEREGAWSAAQAL